jgi:hypothetical protein
MKLRWLGKEGQPLEPPCVRRESGAAVLSLQMRKGPVDVVFESRDEVLRYAARLIRAAPPRPGQETRGRGS